MSKQPSDKTPLSTDYRQRQLLQKSRLRGGYVQVGESFEIKGDEERRIEIEETLERMVERRLVEAEAEAMVIVNKAKKEAEKLSQTMLEESRQTASDLVAQAQEEYDAVRQEAQELGYEAGYNQGYTDATGEVQTETIRLLEGMNAIADKAIEAKTLVIDNAQKDAMALVHYLCRKILHDKLSDDPETYIHLVEEAIRALKLSGKIRVIVGQETLDNIRAFSQETGQFLELMNRFEWVADPKLTHTELFLLTEDRQFSIGVDEQLEKLMLPIQHAVLVEEPVLDVDPLEMKDLWKANPVEDDFVSDDDTLVIDDAMLDDDFLDLPQVNTEGEQSLPHSAVLSDDDYSDTLDFFNASADTFDATVSEDLPAAFEPFIPEEVLRPEAFVPQDIVMPETGVDHASESDFIDDSIEPYFDDDLEASLQESLGVVHDDES